MARAMSRTLAVEIADRVLTVVNPANRRIALGEVLRRHGFPGAELPDVEILSDRERLIGWLRDTYRAPA
jgi:hypothetical protein